MDENNNNTNFIPLQRLPNYRINTDTVLPLMDNLLRIYFNRPVLTLTSREMQSEFFRLITFYNAPPMPHDIREFARAGFYHSRERDIIVCYCCGYFRENWMNEEHPFQIHQRFSPDCLFFRANTNVNIQFIISPAQEEIYNPQRTRLREQNQQGTYPAPGSIVRENDEFGRMPLEENEHDEIFGTLPMANLPEWQIPSDWNNVLNYFEGVHMRCYNTSTSHQSDSYAFIGQMYPNEMRTIVHSNVPNSGTNENSELGLTSHDFRIFCSQRNSENTSVVHDTHRLCLEELEYSNTSDFEIEEQRDQENSLEHDTNETERKTEYQSETHYRPDFAVNSRQDNIPRKFVHLQTLVKRANNNPVIQPEMPSELNHPNGTSSMKDSVDEPILTEAETEEYELHKKHTTTVSEIQSHNGELNSTVPLDESFGQIACETDSKVTVDTRVNLIPEKYICTDNKSTLTQESADGEADNQLEEVTQKKKCIQYTAAAASMKVPDDEAIRSATCCSIVKDDKSVDTKRNAETSKEAASLDSDCKQAKNSRQNGHLIAQENSQLKKADQHSVKENKEDISVAKHRKLNIIAAKLLVIANGFSNADNRSIQIQDGVYRLNVALRSATYDSNIQGKTGRVKNADGDVRFAKEIINALKEIKDLKRKEALKEKCINMFAMAQKEEMTK